MAGPLGPRKGICWLGYWGLERGYVGWAIRAQIGERLAKQ